MQWTFFRGMEPLDTTAVRLRMVVQHIRLRDERYQRASPKAKAEVNIRRLTSMSFSIIVIQAAKRSGCCSLCISPDPNA